ncbi:MAG: 50S ribosomal protein L22 [Chthonomonadales bacterium]|nr:50S ribosomal protein L22 [Chthonomonadales bacterium]
MGKDKTPSKFAANQTGATAKFVRVPPRKARLVMDAVRGKYAGDALAILKFVPNFAARAIEEVIKSAMANGESGRPHSEETGRPLPPLVTDNLKLVDARVDDGPRIKRLQPRAQGRAYRILKRMCHISVVLEEVAPPPRPARRQAAARGARPAGVPAAVRPAAVRPAAPAPSAPAEAPAPEATAPAAEAPAPEATAPAAEAPAPTAVPEKGE